MRRFVAALLMCGSCGAFAAFGHSDYGKATRDIDGALRAADFERLERMHEEFLQANAVTNDGTWMIAAFQQAFATMFRFEPPAETEKLFVQWRRQAPASTLRPIAEAFAWQQRAWTSKGSRCYAQRPSSSRKAFNDLVERAANALREGEAAGQRSPLWHTAALLVAGAQARPAEELDALFDAGTQRFPSYEPLFAARMTFLLPEWGGDFQLVDRFIRASVERTKAAEGRGMYARLYLELARGPACGDLFDQSLVAWSSLRDAFEDMIQRHPDPWNLNLYGTFACRMRDVDTTAWLLGELGAKANLGIWSTGITTEGCREMVRPPPVPSRRT